MQKRRHAQRARLGAVHLLQRLRDLLVERRHHAVEHLEQIEEDLFALIRHREARARQFLGLPGAGELHTDVVPDAARLVGRQARIKSLEQPVRDALLFTQQRAAAGLGRVRGEHRLEGETADELAHLLRIESLRLECRDRVLDATGLCVAGCP